MYELVRLVRLVTERVAVVGCIEECSVLLTVGAWALVWVWSSGARKSLLGDS